MNHVRLLALAALALHIPLASPARAQEAPLTVDQWRQALDTLERDNRTLGENFQIPDAAARARGLREGFLTPLVANLHGQGAVVDEDIVYEVGFHPDAERKDPSDPNSPLVLRQRRSTATPDGAVAFLTDASAGLTVPAGLDTLPDGPAGDALRDYGRRMRAAPLDPSGRFRDVTGRAHSHLVEAVSRRAATIPGPEAYEAGPDGSYSREDLLRMAADRHFLAQVQGKVWETSWSNYLKTAQQLHDVELTDQQRARFAASSPVEARLTRALQDAGVLDFEGGRYLPAALPPAADSAQGPARQPERADGAAPGRPEAQPAAPAPRKPRPTKPSAPGPFGIPRS